MQKIIEIQAKGSYFKIDQKGYLINPTSEEKVQDRWLPLITDVIEVYKQTYGKDLINVYIRGSVAKGEATEGVSDLDSFAFVNISSENIQYKWMREMRRELMAKYPFTTDIEFDILPKDQSVKKAILLIQSLCVYGKPIVLSKLKVGLGMALHAPNFSVRMKHAGEKLEKENDPKKLQVICTWIMKGLLRTGFEITMDRSQTYTRDLYPCYKTFSEFYPEQETQMREVLYYALNPTSDKEHIESILNNFGTWLLKETRSKFTPKE